ncbi:phosphotransferase [Lichenihabitans psoromatis]|uniref:phosphotransferase n=1 Tax=Lichenihabitans psoromatis TaxID=2528642 RepID=UPI001035E446|nr:phosphotransferase [Lichenihabitans psoromatis]
MTGLDTLGPTLEVAARALTTAPPQIDPRAAEATLRHHYGLVGSVTLLSGERDRNYLVELRDGTRRILKFYNDADDAATRDMQHGALLHIERSATRCPVPRLFRTLDGEAHCTARIAGCLQPGILISLIEGEQVQAERSTATLRRDLGRSAALVDAALATFEHPQGRRVLLWDLMRVDQLRPITRMVEDPTRRDWIVAFMTRFVDEIRPRAATLPWQIIHNDMSGSNVMVAGHAPSVVAGIIDFGDMVHAPRINEIAVASSYFVSMEHDPVAAIGDIVAGYDAQLLLTEAEVTLLYDLILGRLTTRVLLNQWRVLLFPDNRHYILRTYESACRLLDGFAARDSHKDRDAILMGWDRRRSAETAG